MLHEVAMAGGRVRVVDEPLPLDEHAAERKLARLEWRALQEWRKPLGQKLADAARMGAFGDAGD